MISFTNIQSFSKILEIVATWSNRKHSALLLHRRVFLRIKDFTRLVLRCHIKSVFLGEKSLAFGLSLTL